MNDDKVTKVKSDTDQLPSPVEFFINTPLYKSFEVSALNLFNTNSLINSTNRIDCFCVECGEKATFNVSGSSIGLLRPRTLRSLSDLIEKDNLIPGIKEIKAVCTRHESHNYIFFVSLEVAENEFRGDPGINPRRYRPHDIIPTGYVTTKYSISKIGQHPSLADISENEINQFKNILGNDRYRELKKGVGIAAHGVGIGSFVYLRRILEFLINNAFKDASTSDTWGKSKISEYDNKHGYGEKIKMLSGYVPSFMIENASIYSILSKGVHELTEDQCLLHFDLLKDSIIHILTKQKEKQDELTMVSRLSVDICKVHARLKE